MEKDYKLISLYASESTRAGRKPFHEAVVKAVKESGTGARCVVLRGIMGLGHGGRVATSKIVMLSFDLPIKIEVLAPESSASILMDRLLSLAPNDVFVVSETVSVFRGADT